MSYKWCAVPKCTNTSVKTPEKLFICVPKNTKMRRKWLKLSRRNCDDIKPSSNIYFCQDHFNLEQDMANYYQYKMGLSQRIIMVDKVLPSKFTCQPGRKKRICDASTRSALVKRQKVDLIKECENTLQQPIMINNQSSPTVEPTITTVIKVEPCIIETLKSYDKSTFTETVIVTAEKSVQCNIFSKEHVRNKAVQTKILTIDTAVSPFKPTVVSSYISPCKISHCITKPSTTSVGNIKRINLP